MEAKHGLLGELERLAALSATGNLSAAIAVEGLTEEERQSASLFNQVLKNYQTVAEYYLMKHRLASQALGVGHWDMEIRNGDPVDDNNKFTWSAEFRQMLGFLEEDEFPNLLSSWSSRLHPDDKARVLQAFAAHITDPTGKTPYNLEYRLLKKNGEYCHARTVGSTLRSETGAPLWVAGVLEDVTEAKKTQEQLLQRDQLLAAQAHWYKSILNGIPLPLNVIDGNMNLTFVNNAAEKMFGKSGEDLTGRPCSAWESPICGTAQCSIARARRGLNRTFFKYNGISCQVDTNVIRGAEGETLGYLEALHDVTEVENTVWRQAEKNDAAKNIFFATMSHEMRTPLNAIVGLSELLLDNGAFNEETETALENIHNSGVTLLSIVNDILDISKMQSGKFEIIPTDYDIPSMINDAIAQNSIRIGSKPIRFVLNIDQNLPARLYGDDLRVKQIITNLLSNAFKYTQKGTVELGLNCKRDGESVDMTIWVGDTGIGIRPEHQANLFSDYSQIDAKANRSAGGTGLGLSITKNLAYMMGGDISVVSTYGQGSLFTVRIRQGFVNEDVIGAELADVLKKFRYATQKRGHKARMNRIRLPYARVLVVDDHPVNLDVAKGLMRPYEMQIDCAASGSQAIEMIREVKYNAVFMDHMMPGMDGMEAARRIREIGTCYTDNLPIIAFTANAIVGNEEIFLRNGFNAFISKPVDVRLLDEIICRFIRDESQEALLPEIRKGGDRRAFGIEDLLSGQQIEGLNLGEGLERFGDAFPRVLHSYAVNTKPLLETIRTIDNLPGYAITVHGIKGSSRGIGAEAVGDMAEALEQAAKSGNFDFVRVRNPAFIEKAEKLADDIAALLAGIEENHSKPRKDKPDNALLTRLHNACEAYDMDGVDQALEEIAAFVYDPGTEFVDWLRANVIRMNFQEIKERIAKMGGNGGQGDAAKDV